MKIEIKQDPNYKETTVIILKDKIDEEINSLVTKLSQPASPSVITGFCEDSVTLIQPIEIFRIYTESKKVFAQTKDSNYTLRTRLFELEELLDKNTFVRISNSEIVNLKQISKLDLSYNGTISILLKNNVTTFVSRRYVKQIKQVFGI